MIMRQKDEGISLLKLSDLTNIGRWRLRILLKAQGLKLGFGAKITRQQAGDALAQIVTDEPRRMYLLWKAYGPAPQRKK